MAIAAKFDRKALAASVIASTFFKGSVASKSIKPTAANISRRWQINSSAWLSELKYAATETMSRAIERVLTRNNRTFFK